MEKVLITGCSGYVGSVLTGYFLDEGYPVTGFDNQLYNKTSLLQYCDHPNFTFINGDVRDLYSLQRELNKNDIIISLAALVGASLCDKNPVDAQLINADVNSFLANHKSKDQKLIYFNTNSGYGETDGSSICTEESPLSPVSLYGQTKCQAEDIIKSVDNHLIFRLATVFGPSPRPRTDLLVNNLVLKALKEKYIVLYENQSMRNYIHVKDVCLAVIHCLNNWELCKNEIYNVGNDDLNMNKLSLCEKINEYIPIEIIKAEYTKDPDKRNYIVSSQKIYNKGFQCQYDLDYGIKGLMKMYSMLNDLWYANY